MLGIRFSFHEPSLRALVQQISLRISTCQESDREGVAEAKKRKKGTRGGMTRQSEGGHHGSGHTYAKSAKVALVVLSRRAHQPLARG